MLPTYGGSLGFFGFSFTLSFPPGLSPPLKDGIINMEPLPFRDLMVVDATLPPMTQRIRNLKVWAGGNIFKYSFAFLCSKSKPKKEEDFFLPIGFVHEGQLVTSKGAMSKAMGAAKTLPISSEVVSHLLKYYEKEGDLISEHGTIEYFSLIEKGKTPWVLTGPHKAGCLRPNEERYVVINDMRELAFGPVRRKN